MQLEDTVKNTKSVKYFKRRQRDDYHYYEVFGGPGKNKDGYQIVINFLNDEPIISVEHNGEFYLSGTWDTFEAGIEITKQEFQEAFKRATLQNKFEVK